MAMLRGRVFEKAGVALLDGLRRLPAGIRRPNSRRGEDPRFWAAGVSVIAHPWSPHVPTAHMNTRLVRTTKTWFGGGADLTPMLESRRSQERSRRDRLSRRDARGLRAPSGRRGRRAIQGLVRRLFLSSSTATSRAASAASSSTTSTAPATRAIQLSKPTSPSCATSARASSPFILRSCARNATKAWSEAERRGTIGPPRPLRRVQPALRPRHDLRPEDGRQRSVNPLFNAARGALAVSASNR